MLGFTTISNPPIPIPPPNQSNFNPLSYVHPHHNLSFPSLPLKSQRNPRKFLVYAEEGINGKKELKTEPEKGEMGGEQNGFKSKNGGDEDEDLGKGNQRPRFSFRWVDLVLDPNPDNIVAVGLTGLLTWDLFVLEDSTKNEGRLDLFSWPDCTFPPQVSWSRQKMKKIPRLGCYAKGKPVLGTNPDSSQRRGNTLPIRADQ